MNKVTIPASGRMAIAAKNSNPVEVCYIMRNLIRKLSKEDSVTNNICSLILEDSKTTGDFLRSVANFAYYNCYFEPDPPKTQVIRTPRACLRDQRANCVDYTVLIGAICAACGLPVTIRAVQLPGQNNYGHVYPVVNGVPLDIVPQQDQTGNEVNTRAQGSTPVYGYELEYLTKFDTLV